ncbi:hypothetical protein X759_34495 [Mesorhizobium sp. LSHC420B00]|nr:hypothetical protein X759_34495 [Mesorhizobium sp. LSHC420B00]
MLTEFFGESEISSRQTQLQGARVKFTFGCVQDLASTRMHLFFATDARFVLIDHGEIAFVEDTRAPRHFHADMRLKRRAAW